MADLRLLVFDWDGTLANSLERIVTCLQRSADEVGLPVPGEAEGREIIGLGLQEALAQLFPEVDGGSLQRLKECYTRHYVSLDQHQPPPFYDAVTETLAELRGRGYLMAVATGKSRRGLNRALGAHGMESFFHATRCADETRSKPHPQMLHELLVELAVDPTQVCMVGDTEFDMAMAVRADVQRIGVSYGAHAPERLHPYGLRGCLDHFAHILDCL